MARTFMMTREERKSQAIARALINVLYRIEDFNEDPEMILEDAKIFMASKKSPKDEAVLDLIYALQDYYVNPDDWKKNHSDC